MDRIAFHDEKYFNVSTYTQTFWKKAFCFAEIYCSASEKRIGQQADFFYSCHPRTCKFSMFTLSSPHIKLKGSIQHGMNTL